MTTVTRMLETHPGDDDIDPTVLSACIDACTDCAQVCTACADACLAESGVADLVECIRTDLDCADICAVTARVLMRRTAPSVEIVRDLLQACATACKNCGDECARHAEMHEHCKICADACRRCEAACRELLDALS